MLKKILIGLVGLVVLFVLVGFMLPRNIAVERSTEISASPEVIYPLVSNYKRFNEWSPWAKRDPKTVYEYTGAANGVGAKMAWKSDDPNVGVGSQEIIEAKAPNYVKTKLDFGDQGMAEAEFKIEAAGEGKSKVSWGFTSDMGMNPIGRYFGLMIENMLGPEYEAGLASMKTVAEADVAKAAEAAAKAKAEAEAKAKAEAEAKAKAEAASADGKPAEMPAGDAKPATK